MAQLINLKTFTDNRGNLTVIEKVLPFEIKRIFYIYGVDSSERGGHRHHLTIQAAVCIKGSCKIYCSDGNAEEVFNLQTGGMDKEHSTNPVPVFIVSQELMGQTGPSGDPPEGDLSLLSPVGMLADIAPTILTLLGVSQPKEMNGRSLV